MDCPRCGEGMILLVHTTKQTQYICDRCKTIALVQNDGKRYPKPMPKVTGRDVVGFAREANKMIDRVLPPKRKR